MKIIVDKLYFAMYTEYIIKRERNIGECVMLYVEYEKDGEVYYNIVDSVEPLFSDENVTIILVEKV